MPNFARFLVTGGAVAAFAVISTAHAGSVSWSNASGGLWQNGMNWSSAAEPGSTDDVLFDTGSMYTVLFNASAAVNSLTVGEDEVVFDLDGHTLSLLSVGSPFVTAPTNSLGGVTDVTFRNGSLSTPNAMVVLNELDKSQIFESIFRVTFDNASWDFDGDMITGDLNGFIPPTLEFNVTNGSQVSLMDMHADGEAIIRASGAGSILSFENLATRDFNEVAATLLVEGGAVVNGTSVDSKTIEVSGAGSALTTTGALRAVDNFAESTPGGPSIKVTDGAVVTAGSVIAVGYEDVDAFFSPYVQISGKGTRVETGSFGLGANGEGVLSDGARLESMVGVIGDGAAMTVESGAVWENAGVIQADSFFHSSLRVFDDGRIIADSVHLLTSTTRLDIRGDGVIEADIISGSGYLTISPSDSQYIPGFNPPADPNAMLTIIGDVFLNNNSEIFLAIFDALASTSLSVEGTVHADGALGAFFDSAYTPSPGDSFLLLSADMIEGSFAYNLPTLPDTLEWSIMESSTEIRATIIPTPGAGMTFALFLALGVAGRRRSAAA